MSHLRPLRRKGRKSDKEYFAFIAGLSCVICALLHLESAKLFRREGLTFVPPQPYRTEVCHVGERGLGVKCSDRETIPLCSWHHTAGPESHHRLGKRFWEVWGLDRDALIAEYQRLFAEQPASLEGGK